MTCAKCKFHQKSEQHWGQCRLNPPQVFQEETDDKVIYVSRYPYVHPQFYCGQFKEGSK